MKHLGSLDPMEIFADVMFVHNRNEKHARAIEFD